MKGTAGWFMCRVGFVETLRAVGLVGGPAVATAFKDEWPAFAVVELDRQLAEDAGALALAHDLRSLDSLHLAAALVLPRDDLVFATWDRRLHAAALANGLDLLPESLGRS